MVRLIQLDIHIHSFSVRLMDPLSGDTRFLNAARTPPFYPASWNPLLREDKEARGVLIPYHYHCSASQSHATALYE